MYWFASVCQWRELSYGSVEELSIVMVQLSLLSDCQKLHSSTQRTIGITNFHCVEFFSPLHPSFLGNHIFSETEKQNKTGSGTPSASSMLWTGQECQNSFWTNDKKCSDIEIHYQQNFKSRSDAHLLKWMNTVETAVDQLFYCQSSAKAQKKSNILFWNQPSGISWKHICPKRKQCSDREGQIKMLLRSTRCTLVCSSTLDWLLTHNKYLTIKVRWKSFMGSPLVCSSTFNSEISKRETWKHGWFRKCVRKLCCSTWS